MTSFNSSLPDLRFQCIFSFTSQDTLCQGAELLLLYAEILGSDFQGFTEIFGSLLTPKWQVPTILKCGLPPEGHQGCFDSVLVV